MFHCSDILGANSILMTAVYHRCRCARWSRKCLMFTIGGVSCLIFNDFPLLNICPIAIA